MPIENPVFMLMGDDDAGPEQDTDFTLEDLRRLGDKGARVTLRLPPRVYNYVAGLAESNRRSVAAEIQAALEVHETLSRMSALLDQDLQTRRHQESGGQHGVVGLTADRMIETLREDLGALWSASFGLRGSPAVLAAALSATP